MPPKVKSVTKSSKSVTTKPSVSSSPHPQDTPIQFVKGVGPRLGMVFDSRGISTVRDLLFFFPRAYEDRSKLQQVADLQENVKATLAVRVSSSRKIPIRGKFGRSILEVRCADEAGNGLSLKWFNMPKGIDQKFQPGIQIIVSGSIKKYQGRMEMVHPEITWNVSSSTQVPEEAESHNYGRIVPIYTEIEGIASRILRKVLWETLERYVGALSEDIPLSLLQKHQLPQLSEAVKQIHFPSESLGQDLLDFKTIYHQRLIYEEFFKFEYLVLRQRLRMERALAPRLGHEGGLKAADQLEKLLPFQLTGGQKNAIQEILEDLQQAHPMNRLIQGDVGSGKTAVAFLTAACALAEGGQAALMAPTEILAEQHYKSAIRLFGGKLNVGLLTGRTSNADRTALLGKLAAGMPILLIGTHALLEPPVVFKNLVYNLIDEQHRFGVDQRRTLRNKGMSKDTATGKTILPHTLILTATPIPRTLALTAYGDLSVSSITELPPGRIPIITKLVRDKTQTSDAYARIREQLNLGYQAYFIYPLVNDSEAEGFTELKSAVSEAERLAMSVFPEFKLGLLHGQMKSDEKESVMEAFKRRETQILVSTTVVEVGVDIPNATIMVVEHAERFGLSQLHQLRGRVGRGAVQSYCYLFSATRGAETTAQRLEVLEQTQDGFQIAEADLEIRGPGEFLGTRQAGALPFRLANLIRDREWLIKARDDAASILKNDPDLRQENQTSLRRYFEREGQIQSDRLKTS